LVSSTSIENIIREQYLLSSRANISLTESNELPDFEREAYLSLILKDVENELKSLGA